MKSGSWSSFQSALPPEARLCGEPEHELHAFHVYRCNCRGVGGLVDYLGQVVAENAEAAETQARLMFDCDHAAGERIEVEPEWEMTE